MRTGCAVHEESLRLMNLQNGMEQW